MCALTGPAAGLAGERTSLRLDELAGQTVRVGVHHGSMSKEIRLAATVDAVDKAILFGGRCCDRSVPRATPGCRKARAKRPMNRKEYEL